MSLQHPNPNFLSLKADDFAYLYRYLLCLELSSFDLYLNMTLVRGKGELRGGV